MNAKLRKFLRASNVRSCKCAFNLLYVQACKRALNRTCDSNLGQSCRASTRNFQQFCVNKCMCVRIYVCKRVSIRV
jgi:hypothetical protein